jgi:hypothetical protein
VGKVLLVFQIEPVGQPFYQVGSEILNVGQNKLSRGSLLYVKPKGCVASFRTNV